MGLSRTGCQSGEFVLECEKFECRRSITKTKWHNSKLKQPGMCRKRRLDSGFPRKRDLPVPASQVKRGKPLLSGQHIQSVGNGKQDICMVPDTQNLAHPNHHHLHNIWSHNRHSNT